MTKIGFIGLGHMGLPMALNLVKAKHDITVFDLNSAAIDEACTHGATRAPSTLEAAWGKDFVISMVPEGKHVKDIYLGDKGLIQQLKTPTFFIDCSTIDVATAREVTSLAHNANHTMIDAPVSGGVKGASDATLTFMVGGEETAFNKALPILQAMGKNIFYTGGHGNGQAVKICNNMMLAAHMITTAEAFALGKKLGLEYQTLFDVASKSSGQSWSLTSYCPVPGPVPTSPANREYQAGFTAAMMLKDLGLAQAAALDTKAVTPLCDMTHQLYQMFCEKGGKDFDFSGIFKIY